MIFLFDKMGILKRYRLINFEVVYLYNEKENCIYKWIYKIFEIVILIFVILINYRKIILKYNIDEIESLFIML